LTEDKLIRSNSESISTTDIGAKEAKASKQEDLSQNKNKQTLPKKKKRLQLTYILQIKRCVILKFNYYLLYIMHLYNC
jgi:hypothetical protein